MLHRNQWNFASLTGRYPAVFGPVNSHWDDEARAFLAARARDPRLSIPDFADSLIADYQRNSKELYNIKKEGGKFLRKRWDLSDLLDRSSLKKWIQNTLNNRKARQETLGIAHDAPAGNELGGADDHHSDLPEKRQRVGRPAAITPAATENDPWQLGRLRCLCIHNIAAFAVHELAVCPVRRNMEQLIPSSLVDSVSTLTAAELRSAQENTATARKEYFASQLVKPQEGELLVDFLAHIKRTNEGERL